MSRSDDLHRFYDLLHELRARVGGDHYLHDCTGKSGWPQRGVYFFFEADEFREDGLTPRVVRVGTHAISANSKTKLWNRLHGHRGNRGGGGNHRGSIFRLRVGEAMLQSCRYPEEIARSWSVTRNASKTVRVAEIPLELEVSEFIGRMPFLWIGVPDAPSPDSDRAFLERNCIALLSNFGKAPIDPQSTYWLGLRSPVPTIRESGLWNTNHVGEAYSPEFLDKLRSYVQKTEAKGSVNDRTRWNN